MTAKVLQTLPAILWLLIGTSCTTSKELLKAKPAQFSGFLRHEKHLWTEPPGGPFHYSARTMSAKALQKERKCQEIWIAPIDLRHLRPTSKALASVQESRGLYRPMNEVSSALWQAFCQTLSTAPGTRYKVVQRPTKGCVELRLALIEFDQTNAGGNVVKTVAGSFVGPFAMIAGPFVKGQIAIEGKLIIHGSGELLYQFADRESDPVTVISARSFNATGFAYRSVQKWAQQFEEMTRIYQHGSRVRDANVMRLNPF